MVRGETDSAGEDNNLSTCSSRADSFRNVKKEERRNRSALERKMREGEGVNRGRDRKVIQSPCQDYMRKTERRKHENSVMSCKGFQRVSWKLGFGFAALEILKPSLCAEQPEENI